MAQRRITLGDVAREAGVSVGTASDALSGRGRMTAATRASGLLFEALALGLGRFCTLPRSLLLGFFPLGFRLPLPCSFDFGLAATKYFDALEGGDIPLCFLFSGTIFYESPEAGLQVAQVPWEKEAY